MAHRIRIVLALVLAFALASCGGGGGDSGPSYVLATTPSMTANAGTGTSMNPGDMAIAADAVNWTNAHRIANGLAPLPWHAGVGEVCYVHNSNMHTFNFFDHTDHAGNDPGDRLAAASIPNTGWGENIAQGQTTGQQVAEGWMNSAGHPANILNGNWTAMGVAALSIGGTVYWTQVFIRQ